MPQPQHEILAEATFEYQGRRTTLAVWRSPDGTVRYTANSKGVAREDFNMLMALCGWGQTLAVIPPAT